MADATLVLLILAVSAFAPPLVFLGWVRRTERYGQEPLGRVLRTFFWGAIFAVGIAVLLSLLGLYLFSEVDRVYAISRRLNTPAETIVAFVLALVIAPFTEEFAKGLGVYLARPIIDEPEDGLVYGAASGFGFAASENLLYGLTALLVSGSLGMSLLVIGIRSISSAFLHASASATFGYGIALGRLWPQHYRVWPYYVFAVAMHAAFNFLAGLGDIAAGQLGENAALIGLGTAVVLALVAFTALRAKIASEDARRVTW